MNERLLQYIWQLQYYNPNELTTADGAALSILHPGNINHNQGPDFLTAKIKVNETTWAGSIELHIRASDWKAHSHSDDKNYDNVILHVVWQLDMDLGLSFPVLELQSKVSKLLLNRFDELMSATSFIACERQLHQVPDLYWTAWKQRLLVERMERKASQILAFQQENNHHWEETCWWMIARNFGLPVNGEAFEQMARSLPVQVLARHKHQLHQAEALLFGQAGLLERKFTETYPRMLQKEYRFLKRKYKLTPTNRPLHFLRMRPANFPTVRLAQLAMLVHISHHLFAKVKEARQLAEVAEWLTVQANDYWHYHYNFEELTAFCEKKTGNQIVRSILINTIIPMLFAYGLYHQEDAFKEKALLWLEGLPAEKNTVINGFHQLGVVTTSATDSQALIQLKQHYCDVKRCLECAIGNKLVRPQPANG